MIRFSVVTLLIHLVVGTAQSQLNVSVSDFRYPETRSFDWKAGLQGSISSGRSENQFGVRSMTDGRLGVVSNALFFHTHERHDHTVSLSGHLNYDRRKEDAGSSLTITNWISSVSGSWSYLHAFADADGFNFVGDGSALFRHYFRSQREVFFERKESMLDIRGTLGVGYGRMRDGTFVIRVMRIIERLKDEGVITGEPSREQLLPVIDRVARTREYVTNFERHEKFLVADVVAQLAKAGIVPDSLLAPFSILKIAEAFRENIEPRLFGWRVAYGIGGWFAESRIMETSTAVYSSPFVNKMLIQRVSFQAGYPLSLWTHANASGRLDLPTKETGNRYTLNLNVALAHQLGERLAVTGGYEFARGLAFPSFDPLSSNWRTNTHRVQVQLRFFVEDQIVVTFSSVFSHNREEYLGRSSTVSSRSGSYRSLDAWVGLTYDLF